MPTAAAGIRRGVRPDKDTAARPKGPRIKLWGRTKKMPLIQVKCRQTVQAAKSGWTGKTIRPAAPKLTLCPYPMCQPDAAVNTTLPFAEGTSCSSLRRVELSQGFSCQPGERFPKRQCGGTPARHSLCLSLQRMIAAVRNNVCNSHVSAESREERPYELESTGCLQAAFGAGVCGC